VATYKELQDAILAVVPMPEKLELIKNKINQTIHFISSSGFFWRDVLEITINVDDGVDVTTQVQSIPITTSLRQLIYCRYPESVSSEFKIACVNLDAILEGCNALGDLAYLSGSILHIRNSQLVSEFNLGYYTNPIDLILDTDENWITQLAPGLIEDLTSSYILNLIGEKEDAKRITDLSAVFKQTYVHDFIVSVQ